jgi:hypothetical protein
MPRALVPAKWIEKYEWVYLRLSDATSFEFSSELRLNGFIVAVAVFFVGL